MKKRVLWLLAALVALLCLLTVSASAADVLYSGKCGTNLTWTLDSDGLLTIDGTGEMENYSPRSGPWGYYTDRIQKVIIGNNVTSIGDYAFHYHQKLTGITIGSSVKSIGNFSFYCCDNLKKVTLPDSVVSIGNSAFEQCRSIEVVRIPDSVRTIGSYSFCNCDNMEYVLIGENVTAIDDTVFRKCAKLMSIDVDGNNNYYAARDGVLYTKNMKTLLQYPGGKLGAYVIPDGVTKTAGYAFEYCVGLTNITIPSSLTTQSTSFSGCTNLSGIDVDVENKYYASFNGVLFDKDMKTLLKYPIGKRGSYTVPDGVAGIDSSAFQNCVSLTGVTLPDGVITIGGYAFQGCTALTSIIIPDGIDSVGGWTFSGCTNLLSITVPNSVSKIDTRAFYDCNSLQDVYYGSTEENWKQISIYSGNDPLLNATIHYAPTIDTTISFADGVTPTFTVGTDALTGTDNYAVITKGNETVRVEQSEWADGKITYSDIAMKDLTQTVTMGLYDAAGKLLAEQSVSVYDAMKARLDAETNVQKKAEYAAQLHLAAAAQKYFDHNVGNLADKDLDSTVGDMSEHRKDESSLSGKDKSIVYGTSCVLGAQLQMKIYFTANDKDVFINGEKVELTASPTEGYYFYCMNVNLTDIFESVSIEVKDGDTVLATAKDSVASYCARLYAMGGEKNETLADALLNYGVAARAAEV